MVRIEGENKMRLDHAIRISPTEHIWLKLSDRLFVAGKKEIIFDLCLYEEKIMCSLFFCNACEHPFPAKFFFAELTFDQIREVLSTNIFKSHKKSWKQLSINSFNEIELEDLREILPKNTKIMSALKFAVVDVDDEKKRERNFELFIEYMPDRVSWMLQNEEWMKTFKKHKNEFCHKKYYEYKDLQDIETARALFNEEQEMKKMFDNYNELSSIN